MSIALDSELERYLGLLGILGKSPYLQAGELQRFYEEAKRVRADQLIWVNIILTDRKGQELMNLDSPVGAGVPRTPIGLATLSAVVRSGQPAVSPLFKDNFDGSYAMAIMVPLKQQKTVAYVLAAVIPQSTWLSFILRYPVPLSFEPSRSPLMRAISSMLRALSPVHASPHRCRPGDRKWSRQVVRMLRRL